MNKLLKIGCKTCMYAHGIYKEAQIHYKDSEIIIMSKEAKSLFIVRLNHYDTDDFLLDENMISLIENILKTSNIHKSVLNQEHKSLLIYTSEFIHALLRNTTWEYLHSSNEFKLLSIKHQYFVILNQVSVNEEFNNKHINLLTHLKEKIEEVSKGKLKSGQLFYISTPFNPLKEKLFIFGHNDLENETSLDKLLTDLKFTSCIFCKIANGIDLSANVVLKTKNVIVFHDIKPDAKIHLQTVPLKHIKNVNYLKKNDLELLKEMENCAYEAVDMVGGDRKDLVLGFHRPPFYSVTHLHMDVLTPTENLGMLFKNGMFFKSLQTVYSDLA